VGQGLVQVLTSWGKWDMLAPANLAEGFLPPFQPGSTF